MSNAMGERKPLRRSKLARPLDQLFDSGLERVFPKGLTNVTWITILYPGASSHENEMTPPR